MQFCWIIL